MLKLADEVRILRHINVNNKQEVVDALYGRNHTMVDDADAVFGLYPDIGWQMAATRGGTAECLRYAYDNHKIIFQLSNETLKGKWIECDELER